MLSKIEHSVDEYIRIRKCIERCLDDAGRAERFLSKPHNRNVPSMYQLIETSYCNQADSEDNEASAAVKSNQNLLKQVATFKLVQKMMKRVAAVKFDKKLWKQVSAVKLIQKTMKHVSAVKFNQKPLKHPSL